jgi:NADPH-dependent glutamate synthase beta subunit-like oxidoreductase
MAETSAGVAAVKVSIGGKSSGTAWLRWLAPARVGTGSGYGSGARVRVAVVGGGLGGLCLAQGLRRKGIDVTVYERDETLSTRRQGYRIHLDGRAARARGNPVAGSHSRVRGPDA